MERNADTTLKTPPATHHGGLAGRQISGTAAAGDGGSAQGQRAFLWFLALLTLAYGWILIQLGQYALGEDLHSHVVLIPAVVAWLVHMDRPRWPLFTAASPGGALVPGAAGAAALGWLLIQGTNAFSRNDFFSLTIFAYVCFILAGAFLFLGRKWMKALAFPAGFLFFMVPLPDAAVVSIEHFLMAASAEAVDIFYMLAGLPYLRDGQVFQLPGITLKVAQECSGIRSSWVLLITSILASWMFLRTPWRRALLVGMVLPLAILRNGFRVLVLGLLCVYKGPHMIHSDIHHRGGPLFFALSLIPLFLLLWWLRKEEGGSGAGNSDKADSAPASPAG